MKHLCVVHEVQRVFFMAVVSIRFIALPIKRETQKLISKRKKYVDATHSKNDFF